MFTKVEPLDREKHGQLRFSPATSYDFAAKTWCAPIPASEVVEAARYYPVVFPPSSDKTPIIPQALFTLIQGENAFVSDKGEWLAAYVPAHIRRYPFILGATGEKDQFAIMVDVAAPQLQSDEGEPLFVKKDIGEGVVVSKTVETAREFLGRLQGDIQATGDLLKDVEEKDVLIERQLEIKLGDKAAVISGFRTVDEEKLRALDDAVLGKWVRSGVMNIIYAHLLSLGNIRELARLQPHGLKDLPPQAASANNDAPKMVQ